jgi:peptidoglycan hydrolase CwlO-like protein
MVAAVLLGGSIAAAQAPGSSNSGDIMPALLQEVRGLRVAMEQMTSAGARVQLALGRLQLQESRLTAANARLTEVRNQLAAAQRQATATQEQATELEGVLSGQRPMPPSSPGFSAEQTRGLMSEQLSGLQREAAAANANLQRLLAQEAALANDLSTEQARWSDLNQRLEDLERSLRPLK